MTTQEPVTTWPGAVGQACDATAQETETEDSSSKPASALSKAPSQIEK